MRMSDLAKRAKLSMGALYRYFDDKDDVFLAIIHDIHNELYTASRADGVRNFKTAPYDAILHANHGYLAHYAEHRKAMRAFIEATMVDQRYTDLWWYMRERHIIRVGKALRRDFAISEIGGRDARLTLEALASMTEQSAYVWYALPAADADILPVDEASEIVTDIWYKSLFQNR